MTAAIVPKLLNLCRVTFLYMLKCHSSSQFFFSVGSQQTWVQGQISYYSCAYSFCQRMACTLLSKVVKVSFLNLRISLKLQNTRGQNWQKCHKNLMIKHLENIYIFRNAKRHSRTAHLLSISKCRIILQLIIHWILRPLNSTPCLLNFNQFLTQFFFNPQMKMPDFWYGIILCRMM